MKRTKQCALLEFDALAKKTKKWEGMDTVTVSGTDYSEQGRQLLRVAGWTNENFFSLICAKFYQTNACPPWSETLRAPLAGVHYASPVWFLPTSRFLQ